MPWRAAVILLTAFLPACWGDSLDILRLAPIDTAGQTVRECQFLDFDYGKRHRWDARFDDTSSVYRAHVTNLGTIDSLLVRCPGFADTMIRGRAVLKLIHDGVISLHAP